MLQKIKNFFDKNLCIEDHENGKEIPADKIQLASAALMIELAKADNKTDPREFATILMLLRTNFGLSEQTLNELVTLAEEEVDQATSLYQFTRLVNDEYTYDEKKLLIENMWQVAFADNELDKYEDSLIRKVSELIYVSHSDFIKAKLRVKLSLGL